MALRSRPSLQDLALKKRRRLSEFNTSPDEYASVAVNARRWSALNDRAMLREPLSVEQYHSSRPLIDPLLLLDCDYPVNAATALVLATSERAADMAQKPVIVDAYAFGTGGDTEWLFSDNFVFGATRQCAGSPLARTQLHREDIDLVGLYDGFTHIAISWVEALGFCGNGEFLDWCDGGRRIGPGGDLPMNTSGGHLAEGRLHGMGFLAEAVQQLRGDCGDRQVSDAKSAVISSGFAPQCAAVALRRDT